MFIDFIVTIFVIVSVIGLFLFVGLILFIVIFFITRGRSLGIDKEKHCKVLTNTRSVYTEAQYMSQGELSYVNKKCDETNTSIKKYDTKIILNKILGFTSVTIPILLMCGGITFTSINGVIKEIINNQLPKQVIGFFMVLSSYSDTL
ncbi:hypothetical protein A9Q91_03345 [Candidatus Gracilibacteria bacterium 28_42_T64]|nr:hypothetical protein A9Q91_03345 [Candidatus Gracilibacteria bacterium 28_42_T64]